MTEQLFELVLVRHGETDSNKQRIIQGHMDTPLNEVGLNQAKLVAKSLTNQHFDLAISSDLKRASQTAEAIWKENVSLNSGPEMEKWGVARERCFGEFQGRSVEEPLSITNSLDEEALLQWGPKEGETGLQFKDRVKLFLKQLCLKVKELKTCETPIVLVVSHGGLIRELILHLAKDLNCDMSRYEGGHNAVAVNTGVSRFTFQLDGDASVKEVVCTLLYSKEHLAGMDVVIPPQNWK